METPTKSGNSARSCRTATPRLSERKKNLFGHRSGMLNDLNDEDGNVADPESMSLLSGIAPLTPTKSDTRHNSFRSLKSLGTADTDYTKRLRSSSSSSPETNKENKNTRKKGSAIIATATTSTTEEQLPLLFTTTMRINSSSSCSSSNNGSPRGAKATDPPQREFYISGNNDTSEKLQVGRAKKRDHDVRAHSPVSPTGSPKSKQRKTQKQCIPTLSFYSKSSTSPPESPPKKLSAVAPIERRHIRRGTKVASPPKPRLVGINKGVGHKIRRPHHASAQRVQATNVDCLLNTLRNSKLRELITNKREERAKVEQVHEILRSAKDPIQMAKPLSIMDPEDANNNNKEALDNWQLTTADFSDLSEEEFEETCAKNSAHDFSIEQEPVIPLIKHDIQVVTPPSCISSETLGKRKFFKSGQRSSKCMEVRITDHIRASVSHGKIALVETPPKKPRRVRVKSVTNFAVEQATVNAILLNLDETVVGDIVESTPQQIVPEVAAEVEVGSMLLDPYESFRQRLPYKTDDPSIIEQQKILLEFLICHNICTDENFEIFIGDPENHKEQANRIVDELYMIVNAEESMDQDPPKDAEIVTETTVSAADPKLFPIFTQRLQPLPPKATRQKRGISNRLLCGASGSNQYQIDAGQKAYGAKQCQQCGLVYTVHEPEEELLHREYHNSVHVLRFKGWIDEDIVAVYPEWGSDGRILRMTERAPAVRLDRLSELINVVDKEIGYSSYIVPTTFVAYFAVRKQQIVGLCLVQPLTQAHRFIQVDGTDYLSEETYEACCGISRIWVSPLHRREGIGSKLLRAVQCHTILGQEISLERVAFSTPTDDGCAFARHATKNENFLTYQ